MSDVKLTKRVVDATAATDRDVFVWDSDLTGFGLRVRKGGSKTFIAQYRAGGGRTGTTRRFTVGRYGTLTVNEARAEARNILLAAAKGSDPASDRKAKRRAMTVADLIDLYAREGVDHLKDTSRRNTLARLRHHAMPLLGRRKISEVRVADIEAFMRDVKAGKTAKDIRTGLRGRAIVRGGPGAQRRPRSTINASSSALCTMRISSIGLWPQ